MEFYIYENNQWKQTLVEISPTLVKTKDTTNDSFSCVLKVNQTRMPYKPMTPFKIVDDEKTTIMWIINDSVAVFSLNPESYKHSLTLVQYRYFLNKHLIRNTVFNQPRNKKIKLFSSISNWLFATTNYLAYQVSGDNTTSFPEYWSDSFVMNGHMKIRSLEIKTSMYACFGDAMGRVILQKINQVDPQYNAELNEYAVVYIIDRSNNNRITSPINIINFNNEVNQEPYIDELNEYLSVHPFANLAVKYEVVGTPVGRETSTFVRVIDGSLSEQTNTKYKVLTYQIEFDLEVYYYTMYDVIDTLLKQYKLESQLGNKRELLFNLPRNGELYDLLNSTYPPDTLSFTQATWYEALTEIFRFYDAGFWFDENKVLNIEYYNQLDKQISLKATGIQMNHSDKNYNNGRVAYYQNALQTIKFNKMQTRSKDLGVPSQNSYGIVLPKPIYDLEKLTLYCAGNFSVPCLGDLREVVAYGSIDLIELDLTPFILNKDYWATLPSTKNIGDALTTIDYQTTRLYFERGGNFINVSSFTTNYNNTTKQALDSIKRCAFARFFGFERKIDDVGDNFVYPGPLNYLDQFFNIEYITLLNGRSQIETVDFKYEGEEIANQSNGGVDLGKLGLSMFAESLKDGEPMLTASCEITEWENKPVEGDYIVYNGSKWIANVINYTILPNGKQKCSIEFSKNFNLLALRTKSDREKRLTNISNELSIVSEDNYIDYIYLSDDLDDIVSLAQNIGIDYTVLRGMLNMTFIHQPATFQNIDMAGIDTFDKSMSGIASSIQIPLIKYGSGNCICFEMQFDHPNNAGNQLIETPSGAWYDTSYFSKATLYTDALGWADIFNIHFLETNPNYISRYPIYLPSGIIERSSITNLHYYKKPNEIFALNYEWCFLPYPSKINSIFIGSAFIEDNALINLEISKTKEFYLYITDDNDSFIYSIMDLKGYHSYEEKPNPIKVRISAYPVNTNIIGLDIWLLDEESESTITAKTWSICDQNGNIYFACNNEHTFKGIDATEDHETHLYFVTTQKRI